MNISDTFEFRCIRNEETSNFYLFILEKMSGESRNCYGNSMPIKVDDLLIFFNARLLIAVNGLSAVSKGLILYGIIFQLFMCCNLIIHC